MCSSDLTLSRSIMGQVEPEKAADASYRFTVDLNKAIEEKRKNNEDPRTLLDPKSPDYMMSPERIKTYMKPPAQAMADEAAKVKAGEVTASFKDYDTLPPGTLFTDPQGNVRRKPGEPETGAPSASAGPGVMDQIKGAYNKAAAAASGLFGKAQQPTALQQSVQELQNAIQRAPGNPIEEPAMLDPNGPIVEPSMLDPNGPSMTPGHAYLKGSQTHQQAVASLEQAVKTMPGKEPIMVEPRKHGESAADFLKRWNEANK